DGAVEALGMPPYGEQDGQEGEKGEGNRDGSTHRGLLSWLGGGRAAHGDPRQAGLVEACAARRHEAPAIQEDSCSLLTVYVTGTIMASGPAVKSFCEGASWILWAPGGTSCVAAGRRTGRGGPNRRGSASWQGLSAPPPPPPPAAGTTARAQTTAPPRG